MPELNFAGFGQEAAPVAPDAAIAPGVSLVFSAEAKMHCTVQRGLWRDPMGAERPTLLIRGENRAPDDWFGIEITLPAHAEAITITCRNYPVHRLFPRLHFDVLGRVEHLDLAHVAAHDAFATRRFDATEWRETPLFRDGAPEAIRLTVLVPSSPWFAMEIGDISIEEGTADA